MNIIHLNCDNFKEIIKYLSPFEIRELSLTCKTIHHLLTSKEISTFMQSLPFAKSLYARVIPITQGPTFQRIVQTPKKIPKLMTPIQLATLEQSDLCDKVNCRRIKSYQEEIPPDIKDLVDSQELLGSKEIEKVKSFIEARDTIISWGDIIKKAPLPLDLQFTFHSGFLKSTFSKRSIWSDSKHVIETANKYQLNWSEKN